MEGGHQPRDQLCTLLSEVRMLFEAVFHSLDLDISPGAKINCINQTNLLKEMTCFVVVIVVPELQNWIAEGGPTEAFEFFYNYHVTWLNQTCTVGRQEC